MLDKRGAVLETARTVSDILRKRDITGGIVGGVAVYLHGYVRTTRDVDVFVQEPLEACKAAFEDAGMPYDAKKREFLNDQVPIHLVDARLAQPMPRETFIEIDGITTIALADLINMKLRSGLRNLVRAQDIADVIGLIRARRLMGAFASKIDPSLRKEFRKLVAAVRKG